MLHAVAGSRYLMTSTQLQARKIAILAADGVEQVELEQPRQAVRDAGAQVDLLSISDGEIQAMNHGVSRRHVRSRPPGLRRIDR